MQGVPYSTRTEDFSDTPTHTRKFGRFSATPRYDDPMSPVRNLVVRQSPKLQFSPNRDPHLEHKLHKIYLKHHVPKKVEEDLKFIGQPLNRLFTFQHP